MSRLLGVGYWMRDYLIILLVTCILELIAHLGL